MASNNYKIITNDTSESTQMTDAPFPFNNPRADVVLLSSDCVRFCVRKAILAEASPVFERKFSALTQQNADPLVLPISADNATVEALLRLCYPVDERSSRDPTIHETVALLPIVREYNMVRVERHIVQTLRDYISRGPSIRVYCVAIFRKLGEDLIRAAARACLDVPIDKSCDSSDVPELKYINAAAYGRLLDYHHACANAAQNVVQDFPLIDPKFAQRCWSTCVTTFRLRTCTDCAGVIRSVSGSKTTFHVIGWFAKLIARCLALLENKPSGKELTAQRTIGTALEDAWKCSHCAECAWKDTQEFLSLMAVKVDDAISKVSLKIADN